MSISQLAPRGDAELALLEEMQGEGKPIKTGELAARAMKRFPELTTTELKRRTPSGTLFWPGRFRFDLNNLKKKGQAANPVRGHWEITGLGIQRLAGESPAPGRYLQGLSTTQRKVVQLLLDTVTAVKRGEVAARIRMKESGFTIKLGKHIKQTTVEVIR